MIGIVVTTCNRSQALKRSLPQIVALGAPALVVDDSLSEEKLNREICIHNHANYLRLPQNRGLACALNVGLSFWLADKQVEWVSYFQDDVDVHPSLFKEIGKICKDHSLWLFTGHDSPDHPTVKDCGEYKLKDSCAGIHMHASREFWKSVMPVPTNSLGTPKRILGRERGMGSDVDWWIVKNSPNSVQKRGGSVICLPGLVRTFLHRAEDSSWGNAPKCGEDAPLRPVA